MVSERVPDTGTRALGVTFIPASLPTEGHKAERPSKYECLVQSFWDAGHSSARVAVTWEVEAATPRAAIERAKGLAVTLRKVARRLGVAVQATVRGQEVYLVRSEISDA